MILASAEHCMAEHLLDLAGALTGGAGYSQGQIQGQFSSKRWGGNPCTP